MSGDDHLRSASVKDPLGLRKKRLFRGEAPWPSTAGTLSLTVADIKRIAAVRAGIDIPEDCPIPVYMETSDVAKALNMSYSGVRLLVSRGDLLPAALTIRSTRLFRLDEVEELRLQRAEGGPDARVVRVGPLAKYPKKTVPVEQPTVRLDEADLKVLRGEGEDR